MKRTLKIFLCIFFMTQNILWAKLFNRTIATVNGEPILQSEYDKLGKPIIEQAEKNITDIIVSEKLKDAIKPPDDKTIEEMRKAVTDVEKKNKLSQIKKEILDQMVDEKLLKQTVKKNNLRVTKREVDEGMAKIKERFKYDEKGNKLPDADADAAFKVELKAQGLSESEFEKRIKEQIEMLKLIDKEVRSKIPEPTDKELRDFYVKNKEKMVDPEKVRIRHILLRVNPGADIKEKSAVLIKIKDILLKLKKGEEFDDLARKYSEDSTSAVGGGDLGYVIKGEMVEEFEKVAFTLDVGKVSDIVETQFGYHILKCEGKNAQQKRNFEEVKDYIKNYILLQKQDEKYKEWIKALREKAVIKVNEIE